MPKVTKLDTSSKASEKSRYHVEALAKGLRILSLFTPERPSLNLTEISEQSGLVASTALRFVATLCDLGFLEHTGDRGLYRPAIATLKLGFTALASLDLRDLAKPEMMRLNEKTEETVTLGVLAGTEIVTIDRIRGTKAWPVQNFFGHRVPMHCTAPGKLMLAYIPKADLARLRAQIALDRWGPNAITSWKQLDQALSVIRQDGFAIADEELSIGVRSASAPILDGSEMIVATLSVPVPKNRYTLLDLRENLAPLVVSAAAEISEKLKLIADHLLDDVRKADMA